MPLYFTIHVSQWKWLDLDFAVLQLFPDMIPCESLFALMIYWERFSLRNMYFMLCMSAHFCNISKCQKIWKLCLHETRSRNNTRKAYYCWYLKGFISADGDFKVAWKDMDLKVEYWNGIIACKYSWFTCNRMSWPLMFCLISRHFPLLMYGSYFTNVVHLHSDNVTRNTYHPNML